jgi:hypothetical protein
MDILSSLAFIAFLLSFSVISSSFLSLLLSSPKGLAIVSSRIGFESEFIFSGGMLKTETFLASKKFSTNISLSMSAN